MQETSKKSILKCVSIQDALVEEAKDEVEQRG